MDTIEILNRAKARCLAEARKAKRPIDRDVTGDVMAIAASMRGASGHIGPEPAPDYSRMSAGEGRKRVLQDYGFDPGW